MDEEIVAMETEMQTTQGQEKQHEMEHKRKTRQSVDTPTAGDRHDATPVLVSTGAVEPTKKRCELFQQSYEDECDEEGNASRRGNL